jgi:hypothetical protein
MNLFVGLLNAAIFGGISDSIQPLDLMTTPCRGAAAQPKLDLYFPGRNWQVLQQIDEEPNYDSYDIHGVCAARRRTWRSYTPLPPSKRKINRQVSGRWPV